MHDRHLTIYRITYHTKNLPDAYFTEILFFYADDNRLSDCFENYSTQFSDLTASDPSQIHPGLCGRPRAGEEL